MPYIAYVDVIDACHLKCPTCTRGARVMKNTSAKMPLERFREIVSKLKSENYQRIGLYSWTEPFLNLTLHDYVAVVKQAGMACDISTTLSLRRIGHLEKVLCAGLDDMIVSMSGADEKTHQRNHVGASLAFAFENLAQIREIIDRNHLQTRIRMRLLRFHYNADAEPILKKKADNLGFTFETIEAGGDPDLGPEPQHVQTHQWFKNHITEGSQKPLPDGSEVCPLIFDQLTIDHSGNVHLCCAFPNIEELRIGNYMGLTESELLDKRYNNPFCRSCTFPRRGPTLEDKHRLSVLPERTTLTPNPILIR